VGLKPAPHDPIFLPLLSPGRCSGTDFLQKSGQTTHCRVSSLSLRHTISDSNHL